MPILIQSYPALSPWNIRELTWGDYMRLIGHLNDQSAQQRQAEQSVRRGVMDG